MEIDMILAAESPKVKGLFPASICPENTRTWLGGNPAALARNPHHTPSGSTTPPSADIEQPLDKALRHKFCPSRR
jgi:hypothetical protein